MHTISVSVPDSRICEAESGWAGAGGGYALYIHV